MSSNLKIGLDARVVTLDTRGFGRYSRSLIPAMIAQAPDIQWLLYTHDPGLGGIFPVSERVSIRVLRGFMGLRSHLVLRSAARADRARLMYFFANNFWFWPGCKTLITIHDTETYQRPELYFHNPMDKALNRFRKFSISKIGDHFITVSRASLTDAVSILKISPEKITTIYNGVNHELFNPGPASTDRERQARFIPGGEPYIFYVGAHDYRKNLRVLVKTFELLKRERSIPHKLVLAGAGGADPVFYPSLKGFGKTAEQDIVFPGYVSDQDLPALYRGAELFVFPSLKEGFGFPVLEAMACGTPVVCSNRSSLPEIVGDAGLLVAPENESEIAQAILKILDSRSLALELRAKGLKQASRFSWGSAARQALEVIRKIGG